MAKSKRPTLDFYPVSSDYTCASGCTMPSHQHSSGSTNVPVIIGSVVLVLLILGFGIFLIVYMTTGEGGCGCGNNTKKKVTFADHKNGNSKRKTNGLNECSAKYLEDILAGKTDPVVIAFLSPGCGWCTKMKPALEQAAKESKFDIYTVTSGPNKQHVNVAAQKLNVTGAPMLFKIQDGKVIPYQGDRSKQSLIDFAS